MSSNYVFKHFSYQDLASKLSTFNCKDIHATNCGKNGIVPSHNTGIVDTYVLESEISNIIS